MCKKREGSHSSSIHTDGLRYTLHLCCSLCVPCFVLRGSMASSTLSSRDRLVTNSRFRPYRLRCSAHMDGEPAIEDKKYRLDYRSSALADLVRRLLSLRSFCLWPTTELVARRPELFQTLTRINGGSCSLALWLALCILLIFRRRSRIRERSCLASRRVQSIPLYSGWRERPRSDCSIAVTWRTPAYAHRAVTRPPQQGRWIGHRPSCFFEGGYKRRGAQQPPAPVACRIIPAQRQRWRRRQLKRAEWDSQRAQPS